MAFGALAWKYTHYPVLCYTPAEALLTLSSASVKVETQQQMLSNNKPRVDELVLW